MIEYGNISSELGNKYLVVSGLDFDFLEHFNWYTNSNTNCISQKHVWDGEIILVQNLAIILRGEYHKNK